VVTGGLPTTSIPVIQSPVNEAPIKDNSGQGEVLSTVAGEQGDTLPIAEAEHDNLVLKDDTTAGSLEELPTKATERIIVKHEKDTEEVQSGDSDQLVVTEVTELIEQQLAGVQLSTVYPEEDEKTDVAAQPEVMVLDQEESDAQLAHIFTEALQRYVPI